jgi:hypothetical protein
MFRDQKLMKPEASSDYTSPSNSRQVEESILLDLSHENLGHITSTYTGQHDGQSRRLKTKSATSHLIVARKHFNMTSATPNPALAVNTPTPYVSAVSVAHSDPNETPR